MRRASNSLALAALVALSLPLLGGCELFFNALFNGSTPVGLSASDGDYPNSVEVSWSAPNLSSDMANSYTISGYNVKWSGPTSSGPTFVSSTSYSIPVADADRAKAFSVTVQTVLQPKSGGSTSTGDSASDTGFALLTSGDLTWTAAPTSASIPATATDYWYVTMLQQGFTYHFDFSTGTSVEIYGYHSIDNPVPLAATPTCLWACDSSGEGHKFYIHIVRGANTSFDRYFRF